MKAILREWSVVSLALSCVLAAFAVCFHVDSWLLFSYEANGVAGLFIFSFLVGVIALCLLVIVSSHDNESRRGSIVVGLAASVGGVGLAFFSSALLPVVAAVGSGALLGFGLTCLLRQWGRYYRSFSFQGSLFNTAAAFLMASLWWYVMVQASSVFLFCLGMLVLVLAGSLSLLASEILKADEIRAGFRAEQERWVPLVTIWQVMRQGWAAVAGLMLNFFMLGLTYWPFEAEFDNEVLPKPFAYVAVMLVVSIVAACTKGAMGQLLRTFYRVALPLAAALMLLSCLLGAMMPLSGGVAIALLLYGGVALFNVMGLVVLFWSAKSSDVGFSKMFAAFCASCAASMAVGMIAFQVIGPEAWIAVAWLLSIYLLVIVIGQVLEVLGRFAGVTGGASGLFPDAGDVISDEEAPVESAGEPR